MNEYGISPHLMAAVAPSAGDLGWMADARCKDADPSVFFGPDRERAGARLERHRKAAAVCASCTVKRECAAYGGGQQWGIWAGKDAELRGKRLCGNDLHLMDAANTWVDPDGHRNCKACRNAADQRARARQRQEGEAA